MTFDPTKPVQTRRGLPARIICTNRKGVFSIIALIMQGREEDVSSHLANGQFSCGSNGIDDRDLINVPEKPKLRSWEPHEVPIGAIGRERHTHSDKFHFKQNYSEGELHYFRDNCEWVWPHEQFSTIIDWRPCGVETKP